MPAFPHPMTSHKFTRAPPSVSRWLTDGRRRGRLARPLRATSASAAAAQGSLSTRSHRGGASAKPPLIRGCSPSAPQATGQWALRRRREGCYSDQAGQEHVQPQHQARPRGAGDCCPAVVLYHAILQGDRSVCSTISPSSAPNQDLDTGVARSSSTGRDACVHERKSSRRTAGSAFHCSSPWSWGRR